MTFKNWKSELKKKGAMTLTAFMLCGSAGTAFAQSTDDPTTKITIFDNEKGDIVSSEKPSDGNVKTITGYQTNQAEGYAANITWGEMLFVYDRGTYDTKTGKLVGSFQNEPNKRTDVEMGGDVTKAGQWYGFNGDNNSIGIENLSTNAIKLTATPEVDGTNINAKNVKFKLYIRTSEHIWSDVGSDLGSGDVHHSPLSDSGLEYSWRCVDEGRYISREFDACQFKEDGTKEKSDSDYIYLNITGKPGDDFMNEETYEPGTEGEKLGTITLSFEKGSGGELTVQNGDSTSGNGNS